MSGMKEEHVKVLAELGQAKTQMEDALSAVVEAQRRVSAAREEAACACETADEAVSRYNRLRLRAIRQGAVQVHAGIPPDPAHNPVASMKAKQNA